MIADALLQMPLVTNTLELAFHSQMAETQIVYYGLCPFVVNLKYFLYNKKYFKKD